MVHDHILNGEIVYLVIPKHIGVTWNPENSIFRSSVWDVEGNPVSLSFKKFVNWGEKPDQFPVPSSLNGCVVMEKLDGCCDENTILVTETGEKTIKQICESKYKGKVLGFDIGANFGDFTSAYLSRFQKIFFVEPQVKLFENLKNRFKDNTNVIGLNLEKYNAFKPSKDVTRMISNLFVEYNAS